MDLEHHKEQLRRTGVCVIPGVLSAEEADHARERLWEASRESTRRGASPHLAIDRNDRNVRVFGLLELDPLFRELIQHPTALAMVRYLLGDYVLVSNFTANIALPGSRSMKVHSDQGIVVPEPWLAPWAINIIWCLNDVRRENGGTLYLPGSQTITRRSELPDGFGAKMEAFEATAGSIVVMDGRVWHTSGSNVTKDEERALLFGYYSSAFLRPQTNWNVTLSPETIASLTPQLSRMLGLAAEANIGLGGELLFTAADV